MINWRIFLSTFSLVFIAELPDKTSLAALMLATRNNPMAVFIGAAGAFVVQTVVAVAFGSAAGLLPAHGVRLGAGLLFIAFAIMMWVKKESLPEAASEAKPKFHTFGRVAGTAFMVVFIAEWGDLTQLATATLAARYRAPWTVFSAALLALWAASGLAVLVGHQAQKYLNPEKLQKIAAIAFLLVGLWLLIHF